MTVVVPIRNERARLPELLAALAAQTLPPAAFEVVLGDDGSSDGSRALARAYPGVRVAAGLPRNSYAARNRAARKGSAPALAFCDADCIPEPRWLETGLAALETAEVAAGRVRFLPPPRPTIWTLLSLDLFFDQEREVRAGRAVTANLFVRRDVFDRLDGFDEARPSGGDLDFVGRAVATGATLVYAPAAVVGHPTFDDGRTFMRRVALSNRWAPVRGRVGARADWLVPPLGVALARRRADRRAFRLERTRLEEVGVRASPREELLAMLALYGLVAPVAGAAQLASLGAGTRDAVTVSRHRGPAARFGGAGLARRSHSAAPARLLSKEGARGGTMGSPTLSPQAGLVRALRRLVGLERLRGIDVAERRVLRGDFLPAGRPDAEPLADDGEERPRLHVADPR